MMARSAAEVCLRARASSALPRRMSAMITITASKYSGASIPPRVKRWGWSVAARESTYAAPVPTAMSVFMSAVWCRKARQART